MPLTKESKETKPKNLQSHMVSSSFLLSNFPKKISSINYSYLSQIIYKYLYGFK